MLQVTTGNKVFTFSEISGGKILFLAWQKPCSPLSQLNDCKLTLNRYHCIYPLAKIDKILIFLL